MSHIEIAENTLLGDLMKCVIEQIKVLPKPWDALSEAEQQDYLDRIEVQVADAVRQAVKIIASHGMINVPATIESVTFKDGCKAVLKAVGGIENTVHLAEASGMAVSIIIPDGEVITDEGKPKAEADQRSLELGEEYNEDDFDGGLNEEDPDDGLDHEDEYEDMDESEKDDEHDDFDEADDEKEVA